MTPDIELSMNHTRHGIRTTIHSIDQQILSLQSLKTSLISLGEQIDRQELAGKNIDEV